MKINSIFAFVFETAAAFSATGLSGCTDTGTGSGGGFQQIESRINVSIAVPLPDTSAVQLNCATVQYYPCMNYGLVYNFSRYGRTIDVKFTGISVPNVCLTALGPATRSIPLPNLTPGSYNLNVTVNDTMHAFTLEVSGSAYSVTGADTNAVSFLHPEIKRIPPGTLWGYAGYPARTMESVVRSFLDSALTIGCMHVTLSPGNYYYFAVDAAGNIVFPGDHGYYFMMPFVYSYAGGSDPVKELVARYGKTYGDSLSLSVFNAKGETFYSWILGQN